MKSIIFMAIVITALCCVTTQAAVVFFDDFESGALDTAIWTNESAGGSATVASGKLVVQASGDQLGQVRSKITSTIQNVSESLVLSSTGMSMNDYGLSSSFGLSDASGLNQIRIGTMWGGARYFGVEVIANGVSQKTFLRGADYFSGAWTITWSADKITAVGRNGELIFDSSNYGFDVPAMGTQMAVLAYGAYQSGWTSLDDVKLEVKVLPTDVIVYDGFVGSTLDTIQWTDESFGGGTATVASGKLTVQSNGDGNNGQVRSKSTGTILNTKKALVLSSTECVMNPGGLGSSFGLSDASGLNQIRMATLWNDARYFGVEVMVNGVSQKAFLQGTDDIHGAYTITWTADKVTLQSQVYGLIFDSSVSALNGGRAAWDVPAMGTQMAVLAFGSYQSGWTRLNDVKLEIRNKAAEYIDDSFDGTVVDANYWQTPNIPVGTLLFVRDGMLQTKASGANVGVKLQSVTSAAQKPSTGNPLWLIAEGVNNWAPNINKEFYVMLDNGGTWKDGTTIGMGLHSGDPLYNQTVFNLIDQNTGFNDYFVLSDSWDGDWKMVWEPGRVQVYHNGALSFDTDANSGAGGTQPGFWAIPDAELMVSILNNWGTPLPRTIDHLYYGPVYAPICGDYGYLKADLSSDCVVDMIDIKLLADQWLASTNPTVSGSVDRTEPGTIEVPAATTAVTVDGVKTSGEWTDARAYSINNIPRGFYPGEPNAVNLSATMYVKHDSGYLYIGVDVNDSIIKINGSTLWKNDSIELFFDWFDMDSKAFYGSPDPNLGTQLLALCVADPATYSGDVAAFPATSLNWFTARGNERPAGYFTEIKIDLAKTPLKVGGGCGFDLVVDDSDVLDKLNGRIAYLEGIYDDESTWSYMVLLPKTKCGAYYYDEADFNHDCVVDFRDFAAIATVWSLCTDPDPSKCETPADCLINPDLCK